MDRLNSRPEIKKIIERIANRNGIKNCRITSVSTNKKGEGFLSEIFPITVAGDGKTLDLVLKAAFKQTTIRKLAPIRASFENEVFFYKEALEVFQNFAREKKVVLEFLPKCFGVSLEDCAEVIVLENLRSQGFEVFDRKKSFGPEHVSLIFRTYGKYHALSFGLQDQKPEEFGKIQFQNVFDSLTTSGFDVILEKTMKTIYENLDDELAKKFEKFLGGKAVEIFAREIWDKGDHPVILHGDSWSNNMMFKYQNDKPQEMRFLDFQLCREGSPVCDLSYCLFSGASKEIFDDLDNYLLVYHESLSKTLRQLGSDPDKIYPLEALKRDWKRHVLFGFLMGTPILKNKLALDEDAVDFTDVDDETGYEKFNNIRYDEEEFVDRTRGLVKYLDEIDAL